MKILFTIFTALFFTIPAFSQTKIMAMGESTTADPFSYRMKFYELARADGLSIDMVGPNSSGTGYDADNAGYYGKTCQDLINYLRSFYKNYPADIILLLEGTNDCGWNYRFYPNIPPIEELSFLIDTICLKYPNALLFVSSIPPMSDNAFTGADQTPPGVARANAIVYNDAMPGMINTKIASGKKVHFIDARGLLNATDITSDGIHPNQNGYNKLGVLYYNKIKPYILGTANFYPNPVTNNKLTIDFSAEMPVDISINLYSMTGMELFNENERIYSSPVMVSLPENISAGLYLLTLKYRTTTIKKKIVVLK